MDLEEARIIHSDLVAASSSPSNASTSRVILSSRRGVSFSPKPELKIFNSEDAIYAKNGLPPASIRSYADQLVSSPVSVDSPGSVNTPNSRVETPPLVRSVLKRKLQEIRIARSVEEGTLNNREAARLLVTGRRPRLVARDSFQLAQLRKGADEVSLKGGKIVDLPMPGSDDSAASDDQDKDEDIERDNGSEEEEEVVEQDGALTTASLVDIILNGAEDLLTLEEAYKTLALRLRQRVPIDDEMFTNSVIAETEICTRPMRDDAPAMIRALHRDISRLLGKVPNGEAEFPVTSSSPFQALMPLHDSTPVNRLQTPSPTPAPSSELKESKPARQGYSEAEVRYRREAAGVGQAAIGMLGTILQAKPISQCFTEADLQSLLDALLVIPRTPNMPTPNPKRTHFAVAVTLSVVRIPAACVHPIREKIAKALECMTSDTFGSGGIPIRDPNFKKEVYNAICHLMKEYPSSFFPYYAEMLAPSLRALASPSIVIRHRAATAVASFAAAKIDLVKQAVQKARYETIVEQAEWMRVRQMVSKSEIFVANHLKRAQSVAGRAVYTQDGEKKTEWLAIDKLIKENMTTDVYWGCAIWAGLVTLIGEQYSTFGLASGSSGFNNIMEKSLHISNNTTRATLARAAWNHAIHAYMLAGSSQSLDDKFRLIQSYKPFAAFGNQDAAERLDTILLPFNLAAAAIHTENSWCLAVGPSTRYHGQKRYFWERPEKGKKAVWLALCGESAASIVYAFVGAALTHREQPAKEMSRISGLPSSDGAPVPETALEDSKQERLDKTWHKVARPIIRDLITVHGVDKLKIHGWSILEALTAIVEYPEKDKLFERWDIDRLLCPKYQTGEALLEKVKDKELGSRFCSSLEHDYIKPGDIPPMGVEFVQRHLEELLDLFQVAIGGIRGLNDLYGVEAVDLGDGILFPKSLSTVWAAICSAIRLMRSITYTPHESKITHSEAVRLVNRHLCQIFNNDPTCYLPISLMDHHEKCTVDLDSARIRIFSHLAGTASRHLREAGFIHTLMPATGDAIDAAMSERAFGTDSTGHYTMVGSLLSMLMSTTAFSKGLKRPARAALDTALITFTCYLSDSPVGLRILGDMTNRLHSVYEDHEDIQLVFWRSLATKWAGAISEEGQVYGDRYGSSSGETNHTGTLLVNLLSHPFRGRQLQSVWHQEAGKRDLMIWETLLDAVVARFQLKGVGPNLGVLETMAGHLSDYAYQANTSTITVSCLASLTSQMSCSQLSHHVDDHFSINENYVPLDFLDFLAWSLRDSYPHTATTHELAIQETISPAVFTLLTALKERFETLPTEFALKAFLRIRDEVCIWFADYNKVIMPKDAKVVDQLYIAVVDLLNKATGDGFLDKTPEGFGHLLENVAPRLSRAVSRAAPEAFQRFWSHFSGFDLDAFDNESIQFILSLLDAVPGFIEAKNADAETLDDHHLDNVRAISTRQIDGTEFPHANEVDSWSESGLRSQSESLRIPLVPATPAEESPDCAPSTLVPGVDHPDPNEYDADMSASIDKADEATLSSVKADAIEPEVEASPSVEVAESVETVESSQSVVASSLPEASDVFGSKTVPGSATKRKGRRKGSRVAAPKKARKASRSRSSTVEVDVKPTVEADSEGEAEDECIVAVQSPKKPTRAVSKQPDEPLPDLSTEIDQVSEPAAAPVSPKKSARYRTMPYELSLASSKDAAGKAGFISSASKWMSRLPSLGGLFSPSRHAFDSGVETVDSDEVDNESTDGELSPPSVGRNRKVPHQLGRAHSQPELGISARAARADKRRAPSSRSDSSLSRTVKRTRTSPVVVDVESDGEDELLLSPETAKKREAEEAMASRRSASIAPDTQTSTGRFDDAPTPNTRTLTGNASAGPSVLPPSNGSPVRTTDHTVLLRMVQEAERQKKLVESMNYDDLDQFMEMIDSLQEVGKASMKARMDQLRKDKRKQ